MARHVVGRQHQDLSSVLHSERSGASPLPDVTVFEDTPRAIGVPLTPPSRVWDERCWESVQATGASSRENLDRKYVPAVVGMA